MTTSFPILKLPFPALKTAFSCLNIFQLLELSFVSSKTRYAIRLTTPRNMMNFQAAFLESERQEICIYPTTDKFFIYHECDCKLNWDYMRSKSGYLGKWKEFEEMSSQNERGRIPGVQMWADYLCKVFNCELSSIIIELESHKGSIIFVLNWVNSRQSSLKNAHLSGYNISDDELFFIYENLKITDWLLLMATASATVEGPIKPKIRPSQFKLGSCPDITYLHIDDVIALNSVHFDLLRVSLTENDMNKYLKLWIAGGNPRLKYFKVYAKLFNIDLLLEGIQTETRNASLDHTYDHPSFYFPTSVAGGITIRGKDGKTATFTLEREDPYGLNDNRWWPKFEMIVWD